MRPGPHRTRISRLAPVVAGLGRSILTRRSRRPVDSAGRAGAAGSATPWPPMSEGAARSEGLDVLASHVEVVRTADGLELAGDDEIEHLARVDTQQFSRLRPADERRGRNHIDNVSIRRPPASSSEGAGNERAKAHLVMDLVMNTVSAAVFVDIRWTAQ